MSAPDCYAQVPNILRDWAAYAGNQDSTFKTPVVVDDSHFVYVATFTIDSLTGADILVTKYTRQEEIIWQERWGGPGNGRDQASDMCYIDGAIYVCGITFTSVGNSLDYVTLKLNATTGQLEWVRKYNGAASGYDVATGVIAGNKMIIVTGTSANAGTSTDFTTIAYDDLGNQKWIGHYDYRGYIDVPFNLEIDKNYSSIVVVGAGQQTLSTWDYITLRYDTSGVIVDSSSSSGTSSGFDCAHGVAFDDLSNVYITGSVFNTNTGHDIKTIILNQNGNVLADISFDEAGGEDIAYDILVDTVGNIYVCGKVEVNGKDEFLLMKFMPDATVLWELQLPGVQDVAARKMCFDAYGNIIVTGEFCSVMDLGYDFLTIGIDPDGNEIWRDYYDGRHHGNDKPTGIAADDFGNIYVTGQVATETGFETVTIRYRTDFYTDPVQSDVPAPANYFYPNHGQITNTAGDVAEIVDYYTLHHYPQLYFRKVGMNLVWSGIDNDTSTADTLHRVDVSFLNSSNDVTASPVDDMTETGYGYLNYYLGHCPEGIINVYPCQKLLYPEVWSGIDAVFSSNNAGMKLYFICRPYSDPGNIGLKFAGQDDLNIFNHLRIQSSLGYYELERPKIYQLDDANNVIPLPWQLSWNLPASNQAKFAGWDSYDLGKTLIIEIGRVSNSNNASCINNLCWSTHYGGNGSENAGQITRDNNNHIYTIGNTTSNFFPFNPNINIINQTSIGGMSDALLTKMSASPGTPSNLLWATYYGGAGSEEGRSISVNNGSGDIYITGVTTSQANSLPTKNVNNSSFHFNTMQGGVLDAFIARFNNSGNHLLYATYIGGAGNEGGFSIIVNQNDNSVYMGGHTTSDGSILPSFPIFPSNFANSYNQDMFGGNLLGGLGDGFILKFNDNDDLTWSTYFGGDGEESVAGITVLDNDDIIVVGNTNSSSSIVSFASPYCTANNNGLFQLCDRGVGTYFDGTLNNTQTLGIRDLFLTCFNNSDQLIWSTYFGGDDADHVFESNPIASTYLPSKKYALTGFTKSSTNSFPIQNPPGSYDQGNNGSFDAFIAVFTNEFSLSWSSFYGGAADDFGNSACFDSNENIFITGRTNSQLASLACTSATLGFPLCDLNSNYYYNPDINLGFISNDFDAYIAQFDNNYTLQWSTFIGGTRKESGNSLIYNEFNGASQLFFFGNTNSPKEDINNFGPALFPPAVTTGYFDQGYTISGSDDNQICMFNLDVVVGVSYAVFNDVSIIAYPNPTSEYLYIDVTTKKYSNYNGLNYVIYDVNGKIQEEGGFARIGLYEFHSRISLEKYSSGMYYIKINGKEMIATNKIIIQK